MTSRWEPVEASDTVADEILILKRAVQLQWRDIYIYTHVYQDQ